MNFVCKHAIAIILLMSSLTAPVAAGRSKMLLLRTAKATTQRPAAFSSASRPRLGQAQIILGVMYANSQGVPQNDVEAMKWYRLAADQGERRRTDRSWGHLRQWSGRAERTPLREWNGFARLPIKVTPMRKQSRHHV